MRAPATLRAGPWQVGLPPELGGAVAYLTRDSRDALAVHLYAPPGVTFLCVEPVSHLPNVLNQGFAIDTLDPGETLALTTRITS
jgi:galactose mutarotase-like enzyme